MKEIILHYLWLHKRIDVTQLSTTNGERIQILNFGQYQQTSGPDFFNAQLIIGNQKWAGTIEMHVKSSDWYAHQHENDTAYDNVILHVVWEHDVEVYRKDNTEIPVLELKNNVDSKIIRAIKKLLQHKKSLNCENEISDIDAFLLLKWKEQLLFERLESKKKSIDAIFLKCENNWEATAFVLLAKNFGLNINGDNFKELLLQIPYSVLQKERFEVENLEALFFGMSEMLPKETEDLYAKKLQNIWEYQQEKYKLEAKTWLKPQFYKLRPDNFPTIRLAQLAFLFHQNPNLFEKLISIKTKNEAYVLFSVETSDYWKTHYNWGKPKKSKSNSLSKSFIDLLLINTVVPLQFAYQQYLGNDTLEDVLNLFFELKPEKNAVLKLFEDNKIENKNAFDSQSLLQLKKEYCDKKQCLKCVIGIQILKN